MEKPRELRPRLVHALGIVRTESRLTVRERGPHLDEAPQAQVGAEHREVRVVVPPNEECGEQARAGEPV